MKQLYAIPKRILLVLDIAVMSTPLYFIIAGLSGHISEGNRGEYLPNPDLLLVPFAYAAVRWLLLGKPVRWLWASTLGPVIGTAIFFGVMYYLYSIDLKYSNQQVEDTEGLKPWELNYSEPQTYYFEKRGIEFDVSAHSYEEAEAKVDKWLAENPEEAQQ